MVALDRAGRHVAKGLAPPEGVHLAFLPPYSPELQPAERPWCPVEEAAVNRAFANLDALEGVLVERCSTLEADQRPVNAHTRFRWWPRERRPRKRE